MLNWSLIPIVQIITYEPGDLAALLTRPKSSRPRSRPRPEAKPKPRPEKARPRPRPRPKLRNVRRDCATGYWYRDDSLELWDTIWKFVEEVLSLYYNDDVAVASDAELTTMLCELRQNSVTSLVTLLLLFCRFTYLFYITLIHNYTSDNMLRTVFLPQCSAVDSVYHLFDVYV